MTENHADNVRPLVRDTFSTAAGTAEWAEPDPAAPTYLDRLRSNLRRGQAVLDKPRTRWLIPGWLPTESVAVLYGPPGSGKSFWALSLALEMAQGGWWLNSRLEPATVLYVAAERAAVLGDRQEAWTAHHQRPIPDTYVELADSPPLRKADSLAALLDLVTETQPTLVVLDTLAQLTLGTAENDGREWGEVSEALGLVRDATNGGSVLAVHHTGKDHTRGMRGHTVLLGSVDVTYEIAGDAATVKVSVDKMNAGTKPLPEWYRLEQVPLPALPGDTVQRDGAVMLHTHARTALAGHTARIVDLLETDYAHTGATRKELEDALELSRNTVTPALKQLVDSELVVATGKGNQVRYWRAENSDTAEPQAELLPEPAEPEPPAEPKPRRRSLDEL